MPVPRQIFKTDRSLLFCLLLPKRARKGRGAPWANIPSGPASDLPEENVPLALGADTPGGQVGKGELSDRAKGVGLLNALVQLFLQVRFLWVSCDPT